jgi:uncharacterized protein YqjF (DUF2071 family)
MAQPDAIDRVTPTLKPQRRPIGFQKWRDLLFVHWPVPEAELRALVPRRLTLDLYEGTAYVGLIPFAMRDVRFVGTPRALGLDTLETNVRTYVHLDGSGPGVYFFSLDAASALAVLGARIGFGLPYFLARMSMRRQAEVVDYRVRRVSAARPELSVRYRPGRALGPSAAGTLEHWLVERYLLYVERFRSRLYRAQVHHAPYPLHEASVLDVRDALIGASGLTQPQGPPPLVHWSPGVDVEIYAPQRCR